jgi:hypothetical protein
MISNLVYDYREAGCHVFGLYGALSNGKCECGDTECNPMSLYKHPRVSAWQHVPFYSEEQFQCMIDVGHLDSGFGVLVRDLIIIDVDARNGGLESYERLCSDLGIDFEEISGFVVETGSQDGSLHIYFKAPKPPIALVQTHPNYKGIDFKNSGYVVGCGSRHRSGFLYEAKKGYPQDIDEAPIELIKLLEKRQHYRAKNDGVMIDVKLDELRNITMAIQNPEGEHSKWLAVGMGLHDTTSGGDEGLDLWIEWASNFPKFNADEMRHRWDTLGKGADVISFGTLMHYAKQDGYEDPVTFDASGFIDDTPVADKSLEKMIEHIDIRKPHGFVGVLCDWINNQCRYPRENLATAAALYVVSSLAGMRVKDIDFGSAANLICFSVAGSGTGKEAIYKSVLECFKTAGIMAAVHGGFKSQQEATRNLLRHQASFYNIDEMGIELTKVANASKRGGTPYMEGLIGFIMNAFTKTDGILPVTGDLKEEMKEKIKLELQRVYKKMDDEGEDKHKAEEIRLIEQLKQADDGIVNPYLGLFGTTTPSTFYDVIDENLSTNGFVSRSIIFKEKEDNPKWKKNFKALPMDIGLKVSLASLYSGGDSESNARIEKVGNEIKVVTANDAKDALYEIQEYFHTLAEQQKESTGLVAIPRRGFELVLRVSLIMAVGTGIRTLQDVLYAFRLIKEDILFKIELANSNKETKNKEELGDVLISSILSKLDTVELITLGQLKNKIRKFTKSQIDEAVEHLVKNKKIERIEELNPSNRKTTIKLKLTA